MKISEKAKNSIVFYYKTALLFFLIPTLLVPCVSYCYKLMFVMLGAGAVLLLYDLFTKRKFLKARGMFWLICFMLVFAVSVVLNYKTGLNLNAASWGYTAIALLLLYPDSLDKAKERSLFELSVLNNIFIAMTSVLSTISIGMFFCLYHKEVVFGDQKYAMGWSQNRLFGLYSNTGYMITALALAITVLQIVIIKARGKKISVPYGIFIVYTSLFNFMSMCMENAKGAFISLFAFVFIAVMFSVAKRIYEKKNLSTVKSVASGVLAAVISVAVLFGAITVSRKGFSYFPSIYRSLGGEFYHENNPEVPDVLPEENEDEKIVGVEIDRNISESYGFFTGRTVIWKFGLEQFKEKPIFGYGPQSHRDHFIVDNYLRHFHNLIIQIMVSVGAVGSVFIFAFFAMIVVFLLKNLILHIKKDDKYYYVFVMLLAVLGMLAVNSMAEVTILFITRFSMFIFWMYLGYIQVFADDDKKLKTDLITEKIDLFIANIFNKFTGKAKQ
ncbi:MAG: O-antigen ligase family protein [Oscillospiraceae bacterium]|nr:O-antigen ligase family protein [Oscillospiraceae bacterium]